MRCPPKRNRRHARSAEAWWPSTRTTWAAVRLANRHTEITENAAITRVSGSLTKAEQSLVADGRANVVREMRRNFQDAMASEMTALVEAATGREAESFLSDHDTETDLAVEVVLLKARSAGDGANSLELRREHPASIEPLPPRIGGANFADSQFVSDELAPNESAPTRSLPGDVRTARESVSGGAHDAKHQRLLELRSDRPRQQPLPALRPALGTIGFRDGP